MRILCSDKIARLIFLICLILVVPFHLFGNEINVRVSHDDDDAEETISDGDMYRTSSDLEMTWDGHDQAIGIRFLNISIPPGSVITDAYITFKAKDNESDATDLVIKGEDSDDADRFTNDDYDITNRPVTNASVNWDNIPPWNNNSYYQTPDLTSIVQEIVSRGGWASGNDMVFIVTGSGQRRADSYNGSHSDAPLLYIEYSETPSPYIEVNPSSLAPFCYVGNNPASDTFTITNTGTVNLKYSLSDDQSWVSCSPTSGELSAGAAVSINVAYSVSSMAKGSYNAVITIEDNGSSPAAPNSPVEVNITLEIQVPTVEVSVSAGSDDAEESTESGNMNLYSGDLELIHESNDQEVGIRFQNVAVPQGAMITNAYIEFDVDEDVNTNPVNLDIYCEASDNPGTFTTSTNDISDRVKTAQFTEWDNLPDWNNGEQHQTPDLSSVVQAIIGRTGWSSGNAMIFIITGSGKRVAESYDGDGSPPLLHIEYSEGSFPYISVDNNNINALTYEGSNAIDGSFTITNTGDAELSYTMAVITADGGGWIAVSGQDSTCVLAEGVSADYTITYTTSVLAAGNYNAAITLTGTNTPNSPYEIDVILTVLALPEGSDCGNVPLYAENLISPAIMVLLDVSSSMTSMMNVSSEVQPHTSDLSSIVQELVNREGWNYESSMVFIITGTGHRTASSYEGSSGGAPLLHVEYNDGTAQEINVRVSQGSDDAEESSAGSVDATGSSDLEFMDGQDSVGIRFQNVAIPKNATITNAYLEFEIDEQQDETTNLTIHGQAHDSPAEFTTENNNISSRTLTTSSVAWSNIEAWEGGAQMSRIEIGKDVISELVEDRSIAWGYGTWCSKSDDGYTSDIEYTKIHVGCRFNDDTQQAALQTAVADTISHSGTPFDHSIKAAAQYFSGDKNDQDGAGEAYPSVECQPMFLIDITDGLGNGTVAEVAEETNALCDINVSPIAVGFGIDNATQIKEMAKVSNERGNASSDLYAMHDEIDDVGQPFLANNRQELVDTLSTITESIKAVVFHGSAPAPTTSVDQGNLVIVAKFNAADWSGELEALTRNAETGEWDNVLWKASDELPITRNIFTINPFDDSDIILYSALGLSNDNFFNTDSGIDTDNFCEGSKPLGDFINSIPVIVGEPSFYYDFDSYEDFKPERDPMVYIGANDGALHAFSLADVMAGDGSPGYSAGEEKWAFVPLNLQDKLDRTDEPEYNMCGDGYCHQYFVDGSPKVGDIYVDSAWKTILVCGEREGGDAYFAIDITSGDFDGSDSQYLWEFRDTNSDSIADGIDNDSDGTIDEADEAEYDNRLGETWSQVSIDRVAYGEESTIWGVFFGSGYSPTDQANKQAYLYGIVANDKSHLWYKDGNDINRIKLSVTELLNDVPSSPLAADFEGDYISDCIYVGNLYGTMYRVSDIGKGETPLVTTLFDFDPVKSSPNINPISAQATYAYGVKTETETKPIWIYYGTGAYNDQADKATSNMQYFFGLKDGLDLPSCYLYPFAGESPDSANPAVCGDLVELEAKYITGNVIINDEGETEEKEVRYIDGTCAEDQSWVIKLYNGQGDYNGPSSLLGSERVTKQPLVAGGIVFFTTFIPDSDICAGNGKTWVYAVDYKTGCAPEEPVFDLNGDNEFNDDDKISGHTPIAIPFDGGPGSKPVLGPGPDPIVFITTPVEGVVPIPVNMPDLKIKLHSWREID